MARSVSKQVGAIASLPLFSIQCLPRILEIDPTQKRRTDVIPKELLDLERILLDLLLRNSQVLILFLNSLSA